MDTFLAIARKSLPYRRDLLAWTLIFSAYLITAKLGSYFYFAGTSPALIWPPVGIALAGLYLKGYRMWSAVALAALVAGISEGASPAYIIGATVGNTLQPLAGAWLFNKFNIHPSIGRLRDTLVFLFMAFGLTTIAPTVFVALLMLGGTLAADPYEVWRIIWSGGVLSVLIFTPLIVCWALDRSSLLSRMTERLSALGILLFLTYFVFWTPYTQVAGISLVYAMLVPLFWISLRFRPRLLALAIALMAAVAFTGVFVLLGSGEALGARIFQSMLFIQVLAVIFYIFASVVEERRTAADELRRRIEQLQEALKKISGQDAAKSEFLAILAHELRNPLAPVLSTLELFKLKRARAKDDVVLLEGAERRLHTMSRLLDDLLDVARISEKRLMLQREPLELCALVRRSGAAVQHLMSAQRHTLTIETKDVDTWVHADPVRLEQVIINLLTNAAKYTEPEGRIRLTCACEDNRARIRVQDNGIGIPPDMLERIFEPFLQIRSKKGVSGVGVGLSLVKQLVEMHEGTVEAYSAGPGLGSSFTVSLPVIAAPKRVQAVDTPKDAAPARTRSGMQVLIVDDNEAGAAALSRLLSFIGYRPSIAFSGEHALAMLESSLPDSVLLDIGLPDIDGYELARRIKEKYPALRIIALTGYGQQSDVARAKAAGCDAHLTKPVAFKDIERALNAERP